MSAMEKAHTADPGMLQRERINRCTLHVWPLHPESCAANNISPVHLCGEDSHHWGNPVDVDDVSDGLKHVKVEEGLAWHGAVQPRLYKRSPVLLQDPLWPSNIIFTDPGHTRIHNLRRAEVWERRMQEEVISVNVTKNTSTCWIMHFSIL